MNRFISEIKEGKRVREAIDGGQANEAFGDKFIKLTFMAKARLVSLIKKLKFHRF